MKLTDICNTLRIPDAKFVGEFKGQPLMLAEDEWRLRLDVSHTPIPLGIPFRSWTNHADDEDIAYLRNLSERRIKGTIFIVNKFIFEGIKDKAKLI